MRKTLWIFTALIFLLPSVLSLGFEENTKETDDKTHYDEVVRVIEALGEFYEREDVSSFMNHVSKDYDGDSLLLEETITDEFAQYDNFVINIKVDRVSLSEDKGLIFADTHWDKRRAGVEDGKESSRHGTTKFIFVVGPDGELVLTGMMGGTVFGEK
jgi:hypothetical protein